MGILGEVLALTLLGVSAVEAQQYDISTVVGGSPPPTPIAGVHVSIGFPLGTATDTAGNLYFTALNCVFRLDSNGVMTHVAGNSRAGYSGDGGPATSAQLDSTSKGFDWPVPAGVAVDASGNLYIADSSNHRVRKVSAAGIISTVAGDGSPGYSGDNGPAISAQLGVPSGVAVDAGGNLYIGDTGNYRIRKVSAAGIISTVAGDGSPGYSGDNGPAISAQISRPYGVAVDAGGNLYIADADNNRIRKISVAGIITTVAGNGSAGYSGDGGPAISAQLDYPWGVALDASGNLYIADLRNSRIRKVSVARVITTVAGNGSAGYSGDGGPAVNAQFFNLYAVAVDASGNLHIADTGNSRIRKVSAAGIVTTTAGNGSLSYSGDGGPAASAQLSQPRGVAVDAGGNLYIADTDNFRVRKVSATGIITTVAGNGSRGYSGDGGPATSAQLLNLYAVAAGASGNLYLAGIPHIRKVSAAGIITTFVGGDSPGYSGDGGPAANAQLNFPNDITVDAGGNLYIADQGNRRIRKVFTTGIITTVAGNGSAGYSGDGGPAASAQLSQPRGVAVDAGGNLYIADTDNFRIRKVSTAGIITTVTGNGSAGYSGDGGPGVDAQLNYPNGVAVDAGGNLYIADEGNNRIRKVSATGIITTVAGNGSRGYSGDGGPATSAQITFPSDVAVDAGGNLYITDYSNNVIRLLTPTSSTCTYTLSATSLQSTVLGGSSTLTITTESGCGWAISNLPDWITISGSATGSGSASITLVVAPNFFAPRAAQIFVAGITVTVYQASNVLWISPGGVVSAASYTAPVAVGSIAAIFGNFLLPEPASVSSFPIPTDLGGLSLLFSGARLAPLFYANVGQVNAQVPWELAGLPQTTITAALDGQTSVPQTVTLATFAPGIFATNSGGTGQGAVLDENYHLVDPTNPATAGSTVVQIYCTGLGPVTNRPATGGPAPRNPLAETTTQPEVTIGGARAQVWFSGLAPGYAGLYQVNAQVPQGAAKGHAVPVVISIGGVQSNTVTIAVQ
ncbi:MAG TPA: hypothetical protein VLE22_05675 [Bryobacteraceae bacterium]|nr:hypothetical protein [Bryobacteraceae bacterium]